MQECMEEKVEKDFILISHKSSEGLFNTVLSFNITVCFARNGLSKYKLYKKKGGLFYGYESKGKKIFK